MDRTDIILRHLLCDADRGTLSTRKWRKYGCDSESELKRILKDLIHAGAIVEHNTPRNSARDGHGRELISWENDPYYTITRIGKQHLDSMKEE